MSDPVQTLELYQAVAEHLSGNPLVVVRMRQPVDAWVTGCTYKSLYGYPIIDVLPYRDPLSMYRTLLHECAHVKLHLGTVQATDDAALPPGYFQPGDAGHVSADYAPIDNRESEAGELAARWERWAAETCRDVLPDNAPDAAKVRVYLAALKVYIGE